LGRVPRHSPALPPLDQQITIYVSTAREKTDPQTTVLSAGHRNVRDHGAFLIMGGGGGQTPEVGRGSCTSVRGDAAGGGQRRGVSTTTGHYWLRDSGGNRPRARRPRPALRLSLAEREEISRGLAAGLTLTAIAQTLGPLPVDGQP
jgi:hypothetical protein